MDRYISATPEQREKLMKIFGCTDRTIQNALTFRNNSDLSKRIRIAARKDGCCTYAVTKESECFFDSDGNLIQPFQNGAVIELYKETGEGALLHRGRTIERYSDVRIADIPAIQRKAMSLK